MLLMGYFRPSLIVGLSPSHGLRHRLWDPASLCHSTFSNSDKKQIEGWELVLSREKVSFHC